MKQFSGVHDSVLKHIVSSKKSEIESKLRETSRWQLCQMKKVSFSCTLYFSVMTVFH